MYTFLVHGILREFEDSHYQYERGLFTEEEYLARTVRWRVNMARPGWRDVWANQGETYAPSFRAEIDRIVAQVGG